MILLTLVSWWYTRGWSGQAKRVSERIDRTAEYFSIGLLARTLFDPFRQIDAAGGMPNKALNAQVQALFDRTFSRAVGFVVRGFSIITGLVAVAGAGAFGIFQLAAWPLLPVLPFVGIVLAAMGWVPWK